MNNLYLKSFLRCKRKAWLDYKGNKSFKIWSPHQSIERIKQFKNFLELSHGDLYAGEKACQKGSKGVIGLRIKSKIRNNLNVEINPQLLKKTSGESKWGKYKYIPVIYKLGHKITKEHLFDLAFCSILLEPFQETKIEKGLVISSRSNNIHIEKISLNKGFKKKVINILLNLHESLEGSIPNITKDRKKCTICPWQHFCDKEAKDKGFLTDIDGIGYKTALFLKNHGISNIQELANANKIELGHKLFQFNSYKKEKSAKLITQSKAYITGKPIRGKETREFAKLLSNKDSSFFVFDIESNPDEKHDFLYGFLEVNNLFREIKKDSYEPILNLNNSEESYKLTMNKISSKLDRPVLHYGETEKIAILKLATELKFNKKEIELIHSRCIDLHLIIREAWILPLKNYSLKTVANWTGFEWEQHNVSGSKALYWWNLYETTLNKKFLKKIIKYNKNDCLATLQIAKWLIKNKEQIN